MIKSYLNDFIEIWIIKRNSDKIRDKNAIYSLLK
jgi:hypothetical protein